MTAKIATRAGSSPDSRCCLSTRAGGVMSGACSMDGEKRCTECGEVRPFTDYWQSSRDGVNSACKFCMRERSRQWKLDHAALYRERQRAYRRTATGKALDAKRKQRRHPKARSAEWQVSQAIRAGRLSRGPCLFCGRKTGQTEAHHEDYSRPLAVVWLCTACHQGYHKQRRDIAEAMDQSETLAGGQ